MEKLLVKNVSRWKWITLPDRNAASISDKKVQENEVSITGCLVPNSWISINHQGLISGIGEIKSENDMANLVMMEKKYENVINGQNSIVLPGLMDAHIHVSGVGETAQFLNLGHCNSIDEFKRSIRKYIDIHYHKYVPQHVTSDHENNVHSAHSSETKEKYLKNYKFVIGVHWDQTMLGRYPTRHDIDDACSVEFGQKICQQEAAEKGIALGEDSAVDIKDYSEIPIFLWRACWHIGVANTKALQLCNLLPSSSGVDSEVSSTPVIDYNIEGGVVELDNNGSPTGILKEFATLILTNVLKEVKTKEDNMQSIRDGLNICARNGLTAVQTNDEDSLLIYRKLQEKNELKSRVFLTPLITDMMQIGDGKPILDDMYGTPATAECYKHIPCDRLVEKLSDYSDQASRLSVDRIKIFSDGSLGAETAAIRQAKGDLNGVVASNQSETFLPDASASFIQESHSECGAGTDSGHKSDYSGLLMYTKDDMLRMVTTAMKQGYRLEIHAIGDAAAEQVLHAMLQCGVTPEDRAVLTHCQVLGKDLIDLIKQLGVICNVQPSFVPTDMQWVQARLDSSSQMHAYIWKSLLIKWGIHVSGGSDAPIEHCSPFIGMYDAIYREGTDSQNTGGVSVYKPEECLTFAEALYIYTVGGAYAACKNGENLFGHIEVGYVADMVMVQARDVADNVDTDSGTIVDITVNTRLLKLFSDQKNQDVSDGHKRDTIQTDMMVIVGGDVVHSTWNDSNVNNNCNPDMANSDTTTTVGGVYVPGKNGNINNQCLSNNRNNTENPYNNCSVQYCKPVRFGAQANPEVEMGLNSAMIKGKQQNATISCRCCVLRNWLSKNN